MYNVKFEYEPEWGNVIFTSSYMQRDTHLNRDASAEIEIITRLAFPADGSGQSYIVQPQFREVFTNEIRFASSWDSPFQVLIGGFRQSEERFFRSKVITVDPVSGRVTQTRFRCWTARWTPRLTRRRCSASCPGT